jgi:hypothetical protein
MDEQLRVTDLVPRKYTTLLLWFLAGATVLAGLEALYAWMPELARHTTDGRIAALDLDSEGSLGAWYSSFILQLAALVALVVFAVRRQKEDDYHGRYRIWAWAALCWQMMSIDESASLHEGFKELMTLTTGQRVLGDGSIWWVTAYVIVLGTMGVRLVLEMRVCRASTAALLLGAVCYAAAVVTQLGGILPDLGARAVMVEEGCEMAGGVLLLLAMNLHARYVILAAQGTLTARVPKPKRQRKKVDESSELSAAGVLPAPSSANSLHHASRKPTNSSESLAVVSNHDQPRKPQATVTASRPGLRIDAPQSSVSAPRLSKAERRALRKHQERESQHDLE